MSNSAEVVNPAQVVVSEATSRVVELAAAPEQLLLQQTTERVVEVTPQAGQAVVDRATAQSVVITPPSGQVVVQQLSEQVVEVTRPDAPLTIAITTAGPQGPPGAGAVAPESLSFTYSAGRLAFVSGASSSRQLTYNPDGTLHQVISERGGQTVTRTFSYGAGKRVSGITVS